MNAFNMTCEAVEVTLPDYLDETLEAWVRTSVQDHLSECMRCAALVRDLRNIEREAAALPDLVPARDLWSGIASRIGAPELDITPIPVPAVAAAPIEAAYTAVIPIESAPGAAARRRRMSPLWMGAAAAALVVLTAGTTYLLTARAIKPVATGNVATAVPSTDTAAETEVNADAGIAATESEPDQGTPGAAPPRRGTQPAPARPRSRLASQSPAEAVYQKEIDMLQAIMSWRKAQLDPSTAAIIEKNLKIIDAAIAQSKQALRNDPASSMLTDQLSKALDKKIGLLRTAAMLPAST